MLTANATTMVLTAPSVPASVVVGGVTYYSPLSGGKRRGGAPIVRVLTPFIVCPRARALVLCARYPVAAVVLKYVSNTGNNYMVWVSSVNGGGSMACITIAAPYTIWMHMSSAAMGLSQVCPTTLAATCTGSITSGTLDVVVSARSPPPACAFVARPARTFRLLTNTGAVLDDRATNADANADPDCHANGHARGHANCHANGHAAPNRRHEAGGVYDPVGSDRCVCEPCRAAGSHCAHDRSTRSKCELG